MRKLKPKVDHKLVESPMHLEDLVRENGEIEVKLMLNGGVFSRKTITKNEKGFHLVNHIDESEEDYTTMKELCEQTNLGEGISKYALFYVND